MSDYNTYRVSARHRQPLLDFIIGALQSSRCRVLYASSASEAPFRVTFETPDGERLGIVAYAFLANARVTNNRPIDEHRFQVKYGSKVVGEHELWQDPYALYTTLFLGIDPERGFFVGADPVLHNPTKFFISIEFKQRQVDQILQRGWFAWERERRPRAVDLAEPVEVLVGGTKESFLRYVRFEREAVGEDQGHRQLLAEQVADPSRAQLLLPSPAEAAVSPLRLHALTREFELSETEVLDLIVSARRLKMAVRGWVAEEHLFRQLRVVPGVTDCERTEAESGPDVRLRYHGSRLITIECKNVLRNRTAAGLAQMDFQRTRRGGDPCSRYYSPAEFDVVAACLHAVTERWVFQYVVPGRLDPHPICEGKLSNRVRIDTRWVDSAGAVLEEALR